MASSKKPGRDNSQNANGASAPDSLPVLPEPQPATADPGLRSSALAVHLAQLPPSQTSLPFSRADILTSAMNSALPITPKYEWSSLFRKDLNINPDMDSRLQVAIARRKMGVPGIARASTGANEIAVIAKVDDINAWEKLSEVRAGITLGSSDGLHIVTGRIPIQRIEFVRKQPCVKSLKSSQPVKPALSATTKNMQVTSNLLPAHVSPGGGKGVVVGIVDFGCDFVHKNFRKQDGKTRIEAIWDQAGQLAGASEVPYGRLYKQADIDKALSKPRPYQHLGYPELNRDFFLGAHGTHVTDIAAGNGRGSGVPGCAPEATIIFVEASANDIHWSGMEAVAQSFGDSVQMLEAVNFIFEQAGNRPCVVNLSLGTNGGPHDGTTLLEQGLDLLVKAKPNRAVVIAASNSQNDHIHTMGSLNANDVIDLGWNTQYSPYGQEMEIWLPRGSRVAVEIVAPDGTVLGTAQPGTNMPIGTDENIVVYVSNRLDEPNNGENMIGIFIAGASGGAQWTIRLHNLAATPTTFHAWIERMDEYQSSFASPVGTHTLGSISCGHETICVGSYDAHKNTLPLSYFSSHGPTRDGREKPEVSAPGHAVLAARSGTVTGVVHMSGTSMAAPAVTGLVALILAEAKRNNIALTSTGLRDLLVKGVAQAPSGPGTWQPGYGNGCACSASLSLLQTAAQPPAVPPVQMAAQPVVAPPPATPAPGAPSRPE